MATSYSLASRCSSLFAAPLVPDLPQPLWLVPLLRHPRLTCWTAGYRLHQQPHSTGCSVSLQVSVLHLFSHPRKHAPIQVQRAHLAVQRPPPGRRCARAAERSGLGPEPAVRAAVHAAADPSPTLGWACAHHRLRPPPLSHCPCTSQPRIVSTGKVAKFELRGENLPGESGLRLLILGLGLGTGLDTGHLKRQQLAIGSGISTHLCWVCCMQLCCRC